MTTHGRLSRKSWGFLAAIVFIAIAVRCYHLSQSSLWHDELASIETSSGLGLLHQHLPTNVVIHPGPALFDRGPARRWAELPVALARDDNHPPMYFMLLRTWRMLFGDTEAALRSLSVLAGVLAVVLLFDAVRLAHSTSAGLWAAALMSVAMPQVQSSREVRGYSLVVCLTCALMAVVMRVERIGVTRRRLTAIAVLSAGMVLTHYYGIAAIVAACLFATVRFPGAVRRRVLVAILVGVALFLAIWSWGVVRQFPHVDANNQMQQERPEDVPRHLELTLHRLAALPAAALNDPMSGMLAISMAGALLYFIPLLLVRHRPAMLLWWLWMICTIAMLLAIDLARQSRQLAIPRYTLLATPPIYAILASMTDRTRRPWLRHLLPGAAVVSCLISLPRAYVQLPTFAGPWRELGQEMSKRAGEHDLTIFWGEDPVASGAYVLSLSYYAKPLESSVLVATRPPTQESLDAMRRASHVWLVASGDPPAWVRAMGYDARWVPTYPGVCPVWELVKSPIDN